MSFSHPLLTPPLPSLLRLRDMMLKQPLGGGQGREASVAVTEVVAVAGLGQPR